MPPKKKEATKTKSKEIGVNTEATAETREIGINTLPIEFPAKDFPKKEDEASTSGDFFPISNFKPITGEKVTDKNSSVSKLTDSDTEITGQNLQNQLTVQTTKMEFRVPEHLQLDGNLSENFKKFKQRFEIYLKASESEKKSEQVKIAILLNVIGDDALDVYNTFELSKNASATLKEILDEFENYCNPKKDEVYERFKFLSRVQKEDESFDHFLTEVKQLASTCEFEHTGEMAKAIRDRIIFGIKSKKCQEKLLAVGNITLEETIKKCRLFELDKTRLEDVQQNKTVDHLETQTGKGVNYVKKTGQKQLFRDKFSKIGDNKKTNFNKYNSRYENKKLNLKVCERCLMP